MANTILRRSINNNKNIMDEIYVRNGIIYRPRAWIAMFDQTLTLEACKLLLETWYQCYYKQICDDNATREYVWQDFNYFTRLMLKVAYYRLTESEYSTLVRLIDEYEQKLHLL